jgi:hypothetical protein
MHPNANSVAFIEDLVVAALNARRVVPGVGCLCLRERKAAMPKIILMVPLLIIQAAFAGGQLKLSPMNTGDCVAVRITTKRTTFVDALAKKYCAEHNSDKAKEKKCIENSKSDSEISFFTDRCSVDEYFIGINGKEVRLRRISKRLGKLYHFPHHFIGSFAGKGVSVEISHPRLIKKIYGPDGARDEDNVEDAEYKVLVTVKKGSLKKSFKGILWYGR